MFNVSIPLEEKPTGIFKAHPLSYFFVVLKVILVSLFLLLILYFVWPDWWDNYYGKLVAYLIVFFLVLYIFIKFWKKFLGAYLITPCRIIDVTQEGFLKRTITEIDIEDVDRVKIVTGLFQKIFKMGKIIIGLKEKKGILVFYDVKDPYYIEKLILEIKEEREKLLSKKGSECKIIMEENRAELVPLTYSYYGDKAKDHEKGERPNSKKKKNENKDKGENKDNIIVVKKNKK